MSQNHKGGLQNFSLTLTSRKHSKSKTTAPKIQTLSNFFINKLAQTEMPPPKNNEISLETIEQQKEEEPIHFQYSNYDSPYQNLTKTDTKILLNDSANDEADFRSPIRIRKPNNPKSLKAPVQKSQSKGKTQVKKRQRKKYSINKSTSQNSAVKIIEDNFTYAGENAEHLQMAIALSKSTYEAECDFICQSPSKEQIPNITELLCNTKPTFLERFGFTSDNRKISVENRRITTVSTEATKKTRNRFKYITPILNIRTNEERESLVAAKISNILCQKNPELKKPCEYTINSNRLNNFISRDRSIFNLEDVYEKNNFNVKYLEISQNMYKPGHLLKDWNLIPGRDKSPCRMVENVSNEEKPCCSKEQDTKLSPIRIYTKETSTGIYIAEGTSGTTALSNKRPPGKKSPVKNVSETISLGASCSFNVSTKARKTILGSFNAESVDCATTNSFANSITSPIHSFSSSCRSISPDLFGSDDETNERVLDGAEYQVPESSYLLKTATQAVREHSFLDENNAVGKDIQKIYNPLENSAETLVNCLTSGQIKIRDCNIGDIKSLLLNEVVDLTDDDNIEAVNKFPNANVSFGNRSINNCCVSPQVKNKIKKSSVQVKSNIYSLDDLEDDNDKIKGSPYNEGYFKDETENEHDNENVEDFNNSRNPTCNKNKRRKQTTNTVIDYHVTTNADVLCSSKCLVTSYANSSTYIETRNDNAPVHYFENVDKSLRNKTRGKRNIRDGVCTGISNKTNYENAYNINYPVSDYHLDNHGGSYKLQNCFYGETIVEKQGNSLVDTPKRKSFYDQVSNYKNDTCHTICSDVVEPRRDISSTNNHLDNHGGSCELQNCFYGENIIEKQDNSLVDTPKRKSFCDEVSNYKNDTCHTICSDVVEQRRDISSTNNENSSLEEKPKRSIENERIKSPCFDDSNFYDSSNLNVTDYVNNMLNQENFSFDKTKNVTNTDVNNAEAIVDNDEEISLRQCSQSSIVLDEELNYSSHFASPLRVNDKADKVKYLYDEIKNLEDEIPQSSEIQQHICHEAPLAPLVSPDIVPKTTMMEQISTPNNLIMKTENVTPMPEYDNMATPLIIKELQKIGVKPLKRTRGTKLLKYIYESTHPLVGSKKKDLSKNSDSGEDTRTIKRRKKGNENSSYLESIPFNLTNSSFSSESIFVSSMEIIGDRIIENEKPEDLLFERKLSVRIPSCKVPLQIVWHNLVSSHPAIKENILLYEPLQLESLHMMLKEQGFKFHIQDLLTFLDKKCVTISTGQKRRCD